VNLLTRIPKIHYYSTTPPGSNLCMPYDRMALALRYIAGVQGRAKRRASRAAYRDAKP